MRYDLVTISRQYGAGGNEIAERVAARLGWPVVNDPEILKRAAMALAVNVDAMSPFDEYVLTTLDLLGTWYTHGTPEALHLGADLEVTPDQLARVEHQVLRAAARRAPAVLVGHGAQCLFASRPGTLHVKVVAPARIRAERVAARTGTSLEEASAEVARRDKARARYLKYHFDADTNDPLLYGVAINTGALAIDAAAATIADLVNGTREDAASLARRSDDAWDDTESARR